MTASTGLFKSSVISDATGNGGLLTNNAVVDNAAENLFPHVTEAQRTVGLTRYRKAFLKKLSGTLTLAKYMADILSRAGDYILLKRGFDDDTQAKSSDYGWTESNITWTLATRTVSALGTARSLNAGDEVFFFSNVGVFRGRANVTTSTSSSTSFVIDTVTEGSNPVTGDYAITFWKGSAELTQALTGGTSKTIMCAFEANGLGVYSYKDIALIDWDTLTDGLPTIEYLDQTYAVYTIGTGGILDEDCSDITDWTDNDTAGAASTQATFQGRDTFQMTVTAHAAGRKAERYIDAGTIGTTYTIEIRLYCDLIGTQAAGDYFSLAVDNGAATLGVRWCTDGLFIYDGAAWNEVGTNIVDSDVWTVWRFAVTTGATVAVYKNGFLMAAAQDCSDATTPTDGLVTIAQNGVITDNVISYVDFVKLSDLVCTDSTECFIQADTACVSNHAVKTRGTVTGTEAENLDVDGLILVIKVNGGTSQTVTLAGNGQTAAQVVVQISLSGATAYVSGTNVALRTDSYYSDNSIQVLSDSTADTILGLDNTIHYGTDGTVVAAYLDLGTIAASHSTPVKVSPLGTFTDNIVNYDLGAIYDAWTVTFSSATAFTVAGATEGTIGSGVISTAFAVAHWGSYYFSIPTSCWGGTWAAGDTVTFTTYPSAEGIWFKEVVPASTAAWDGNKATYTLDAETA